jgi:predicted Zn-dependent protease
MSSAFRIGLIASAVLLGTACGAAQQGTEGAPDGQGAMPDGRALRVDLERPDLKGSAPAGPLIGALAAHLDRSMSELSKLPEHRPYFLAYQITDRTSAGISATLGALTSSTSNRNRTLDVDVRVGDHKIDNTHPISGDPFGASAQLARGTWLVSLDDDLEKLAPTLWIATDKSYKNAVEAYLQVKSNAAVKAKADDDSDDFSSEGSIQYYEPSLTLELDRDKWEGRVRDLSAMFKAYPEILTSEVTLGTDVDTRYLVNSEGARIQVSRTYIVLTFSASARTEDGMDLSRYDAINVSSFDAMPRDAEIRDRVQKVIDDLMALRRAPLAEPYLGPAILDGEAAGVFFHEVFGHRVEGHRQKGTDEGQTFAKKVGEAVMPGFIDVYDDPRIRRLNGVELRGFYAVDDEGVRGQRAPLVDGGVLRGFLMSRAPARGFQKSNGHGRRQEGKPVVARQGNLIVHPRRVVETRRLKQMLIDEVKKEGKPYGLRFAEVEGGFTQTMRFGPQSFRVSPVMVYRVYADGREELVRGADIDGTPLTALSQIIAAGDDIRVFNGTCGAESGWVPVSAASPSLLVGKVEISRKFTMKDKPPILSPPERKGQRGAKR